MGTAPNKEISKQTDRYTRRKFPIGMNKGSIYV